MGCCCSTDKKGPVEPAKRSELVKGSTAESSVSKDEPVTTYNVITTNKTEVVESNVIVVEETKAQTPPPVTSDSNKSFYSAVEGTPSESGMTETSVEPSVTSRNSDAALLASRLSGSVKRGALSSGNSSRSSFSVRKEHREFRFFLPIIEETDDWIPTDLAASYSTAVNAIKTTLKEGEDVESETKDDTYLISRSYFGLKYLEDKKLEMRVKTESSPIWMEKWSKVRFGKKPIGHYKTDIVSYLHDVGHKDPSVEKCIDEPQYLTIQKKSNNSVEANIEVSDLTVIEGINNSSGSSSSDIKRRQWLTVCMIGDSNKIEEFAWNHHHNGVNSLWEAIQLGKSIYDANTESALSHAFVPVVSGYPLWIKLAAGKINTVGAVNDEIVPSLTAFTSFFTEDQVL